jgi:hypothetical protein
MKICFRAGENKTVKKSGYFRRRGKVDKINREN